MSNSAAASLPKGSNGTSDHVESESNPDIGHVAVGCGMGDVLCEHGHVRGGMRVYVKLVLAGFKLLVCQVGCTKPIIGLVGPLFYSGFGKVLSEAGEVGREAIYTWSIALAIGVLQGSTRKLATEKERRNKI